MSAVGADGLTNEQWAKASNPSVDQDLANAYKAYNKSEIGKLNTEIEAAYGSTADNRIVNAGEDVINSVIKNLPTLKRHFDRLQKRSQFDIKYSGEANGPDDALAITNNREMDKDGYWDLNSKKIRPYIIFYGSAFASYRTLAHTTLHEFGHIESFSSGLFDTNMNYFQSLGYSVSDSHNFAVAADEVFAYNWAYRQGSLHPYVQMDYDITKSSRPLIYITNVAYIKARNKVEDFYRAYPWSYGINDPEKN